MAAIAAGLTAGAAHEAATAEVKGEVAAAAEEARLTQEAFACKEAEVKALEEALAQERATAATAKAQADAARKDAIEAARRKVAEERAKTEAELAALEAEKARLQQAREAEAARAREEAEWASCRSHSRRDGGGGCQAPSRDSPGRIPSGDPSKAF